MAGPQEMYFVFLILYSKSSLFGRHGAVNPKTFEVAALQPAH